MANMSYCRFENTYGNLKDCFDHINDKLDSHDEIIARKHLIDLCSDILEEVGQLATSEDGYNDNENMDDDESS